MLKQTIWCLAIGLLVAGCTPPPVDPKATVVQTGALLSDGTPGTGTLHAIFPCHISDIFVPNALRTAGYNVELDGKTAANLNTCQYREIAVPAGKHAIRLGSNLLDVGKLFGNGQEFAIPAGGHVYFAVRTEYYGGGGSAHFFYEVPAEQADRLIAAIRHDTEKKS